MATPKTNTNLTNRTPSHIVGYTSKNIPQKYTIIPIQFENVAGGTINLLDYIDVDGKWEQTSCYDEVWTGVQILVQNGNAYNSYLWASDAYDEENDKDVPGWADDTCCLKTSIAITTGTSVWIYSPDKTAVAMSFSGKVLDASSKTKDCAYKYSLICNPFPMSTTFGDIQMSGNKVERQSCYDEDWSDGIQILTQFGNAYKNFIYAFDAYDEENDKDVPGWADDTCCLVTDETECVAAGCGFWFYNPNKDSADAITITFEK